MSRFNRGRRPPPPSSAPRFCKTPGCNQHRQAGRYFCGSCWFALTPAFRMAIEQAVQTQMFGHPSSLIRDAGAFVRRQSAVLREPEMVS